MPIIASGRIASWEGGSLWVFDVPAGAPDRNQTHTHHAYQLTFAVEGAFTLHLEDRALSGPLAIIAPDAPHAFEARGLVALLFVEPESSTGRALSRMLHGAPGLDIALAAGAADAVKAAFRPDQACTEALRVVGQRLYRDLTGNARAPEPDRRVRDMIKWAIAHLDAQPGIAAAAKHVGLSTSRASHLFVEQTGLAFRTYVLWLRLQRATDAYARGESLTAAAQFGGFADSAHLSRTFRRMFGLSAADLQIS